MGSTPIPPTSKIKQLETEVDSDNSPQLLNQSLSGRRPSLEQAFREAFHKRLRAAVLADLIEEARVTQAVCAPDERPLMTAYHDALQLLAAGGVA